MTGVGGGRYGQGGWEGRGDDGGWEEGARAPSERVRGLWG